MTIDLSSIELIDFLSRIGICPVEKQGREFMYLSPFRREKKASFSVHETKNCWYDFGVSGNSDWGLIGFIKMFYGLDDFKSCLSIVSEVMDLPSQGIKCPSKEHKTVLELVWEEPISDKSVIDYIESRRVDSVTAKRYLRQCVYTLYDKEKLGISYDNIGGGTEILSLDGMKCSLGTKTYSMIKGNNNFSIFEGYFDFLSYLKLVNKRRSARSVIILNSVTSIKRAMDAISPLSVVHTYLDRDKAGFDCRDLLFRNFTCTDHSGQYDNYKDLNDMLRGIKQEDESEEK